ncbi:hypothetical protein AB4Z22_33305, partial [Paenibacillus sp. TAF58]
LMVELQPSKLIARVRFPPPASNEKITFGWSFSFERKRKRSRMGSTVREDIIEYPRVGRASKYTTSRFRRKHFK